MTCMEEQCWGGGEMHKASCSEEQCVLRSGRGCVDHVSALKMGEIYICIWHLWF